MLLRIYCKNSGSGTNCGRKHILSKYVSGCGELKTSTLKNKKCPKMALLSRFRANKKPTLLGRFVVEVTGLEPAASWSQTRHSTKLSYTSKRSLSDSFVIITDIFMFVKHIFAIFSNLFYLCFIKKATIM